MRNTAFLLMTLLFAACGAESDSGGEETDVDADADADGDTDIPLWEGEVTYRTDLDGAPVCDAVVSLLGTPYTGDCYGCTLAYDIDASIVANESTADCRYLEPFYTWLDDQDVLWKAPRLAWWETYAEGRWPHLLAAGFAFDVTPYEGRYYPGPYWYPLVWDGSGYGFSDYDPATRTLTWEIVRSWFEYDYYDSPYFQYCAWAPTNMGTTEPCDGAFTVEGRLDTTTWLGLDVWGFTVPEANAEPIHLRVDAPDPDTACAMGAFLNTPDACSDWFAADNTACSGSTALRCPAIDLEEPQPGEWQIVVYAQALVPAPSAMADYRILVDAAFDPGLVQVADDQTLWGILGTVTLTVSGTGGPIPTE
jgi:hypothetical protein